ncbi:P-loop containing nucleoside triphosphate hydrolase protein [Rozella allomycis CSF55]|uniref:P-loop containing nucleoside triphosphate hydrolase protein n=1 Tax=Rozella allomycis (strain CSF55) TaxID=988480 RepID=A0A075ASN1_ROZAC|nr:P-loop containing nucleoside triphosphate hydrolase domain-containing protein [Rozella allomycis CSF55]RKP18440.1 P-loop containing nucleoside triphosphate hydrolase protein [Rozella allomycis CSF55]|eukprot:EPZ33155.1 P-loop containing nucleoside triphosphate hydrolase domain-containing protein [Rozella allomycis CSF55]
MDSLPWVEKYRPADLSELASHKDIISTISRFIDENRLPHMLFYGPPGTGKTTTILACAKKIYGPKFKSMILELNASDDRGIDVVRDQIKSFASTKLMFNSSGMKLIVLDEADAMTNAAQAALRRGTTNLLYARNVRFCLICNYASKIIPAIQSRCTKFRFSPLPIDTMTDRLNFIVDQENINITPQGKNALLKLSGGDMRRLVNILQIQATHTAFDVITDDSIYLSTGKPNPSDVEAIIHWLMNDSFKSCYDLAIYNLQKERGLALVDIIHEVAEHLIFLELPSAVRLVLLEKISDVERNLSTGSHEKIQLAAFISSFTISRNLTNTQIN